MEPYEEKNAAELPGQAANEPQKDVYTPRPRWQIVLAWVALAIFVAGVILYYWHIMHKY